MAGFSRASVRARSRSQIVTKVLAIAVMVLFLGLVGMVPEAAAQGFGQNQGAAPPNQGALSQNPDQNRFPEQTLPNFPLTSRKRKQALVDYNFKKLKKHAADLAELAKSLQNEIEKSNANVLSLEIVRKAAKAEKLAKKIKNEAKAY